LISFYQVSVFFFVTACLLAHITPATTKSSFGSFEFCFGMTCGQKPFPFSASLAAIFKVEHLPDNWKSASPSISPYLTIPKLLKLFFTSTSLALLLNQIYRASVQ